MKPLGRKTYGSIGHLPTSRLGPGDWHVHEGQARIATQKLRDKHDRVFVQEKLDGSCCGVGLLDDGQIVALGRAGYLAQSSKFEQHQLFAHWVRENEDRFRAVLDTPGERVVGEWMAQAHGTVYAIAGDPFVAFDIMQGTERLPTLDTYARLGGYFETPHLVETEPVDPVELFNRCRGGFFAAEGDCEGFVYRVERHGKVDFLAKWVRPDKVDGCLLPEMSGKDAVWLWRPKVAVPERGEDA